MTLPGRDIANAAVVMLFVVPVDEACRPSPGSVQLGEPFERELWPILGGAEQRLDEGIVVADPRAGVGGFDAEPMQHREHGCRPQGGAVVAVQHRAHRHDVDALGQGGAPRQMRGVFGAVGVMHLEADDLAAVKIEDQIQVSANAHHSTSKLYLDHGSW